MSVIVLLFFVRDGDRFVNMFTKPKHVLSGCTFEFLYMIRSLQRFVSVGRRAASLLAQHQWGEGQQDLRFLSVLDLRLVMVNDVWALLLLCDGCL